MRTLRGHTESDGAAHAVSGQSGLSASDVFPSEKIIQGTFRIRGSELQGGVGIAASGLAGSAVVHAEYGDALPGQAVGYHEKRFVLPCLFIPVLRPAAGNKEHGREWPFPFGQSQ